MLIRTVVALASAGALSSCSMVYDVHATIIDARLAFVSDDPDFTCIGRILVRTETGPPARPAPGDDHLSVTNGGGYWEAAGDSDCAVDYPIFYGDSRDLRQVISPKPLQAGIPYAVSTTGLGAIGSGCFRITPGRTIENLPYDQCRRP